MLSLCELKHHCRTCWMKLEFTNDGEDLKKSAQICKYPEVQQIMHLCLSKELSSEASIIDMEQLDGFMPNLCAICLEKWQDFAVHYELAIKNQEKLRMILGKANLGDDGCDDAVGQCAETNKVYIENQTANDFSEVEKYETASPFYNNSRSNTASPNPNFEREFNTTPSSESLCKSEISNDDDKSSNDDECFNEDYLENKSKTKTSKQTKKVRKRRPPKDKIENYTKKILKSSKKFSSSSSLKQNDDTENQTKRKVYRCEPCKKYFYELLTYEGHMKRVHEGIKRAYQCKECDKAYSLYKNLVGHIADRHSAESQEIHKCDECNKTYKTKTTLKKHIKLQHSQENENDDMAKSKRVICDQCGFLAAHQDSLTQHIKNKHTETEEIRCEQCPKVFKSQYNLKYHIQSFHTKVVAKPFKCQECSMAFTRRPLLNIHIRSHLNYSERMKCDFEGCDVRFIKMSSKRRHMRLVHLKVKQHICDICGEAFGIKATLRHHRYIHTGEKPYKCNVCGQGFRQATAMKTHRKTHFGREATSTTIAETTTTAKPPAYTGDLQMQENVNMENAISL